MASHRSDRRVMAQRSAAAGHVPRWRLGTRGRDRAVEGRRPGVAPALSTTLKDEPEVAWHRDGVKMPDVLEALNAIRADFARAEAGDHEHAHPRNCVMTLVAVTATDAEEKQAQRTCRTIGAQHPAQ